MQVIRGLEGKMAITQGLYPAGGVLGYELGGCCLSVSSRWASATQYLAAATRVGTNACPLRKALASTAKSSTDKGARLELIFICYFFSS